MKRCTRCFEVKPLGDFSPRPGRAGGVQSWCRSCHREYVNTRRSQPGGRVRHNAAVRARQRAMAALAERHHEEFEALLDRERVLEGLPVTRWERTT